jgi:hypothetical protein
MNKSSFDSQASARHLGATFAAPLAPSPQGALFEMAPDSECSDLLITASQLASFDPGILAGIERGLIRSMINMVVVLIRTIEVLS